MPPKRIIPGAREVESLDDGMQIDHQTTRDSRPPSGSPPPPFRDESQEEQEETSTTSKAKGKGKGKQKERNNGWSDEEESDKEMFDATTTSKRTAAAAGEASLEEPLSPDLIASLPVYLSTSLDPATALHVFQYPIFSKDTPLPVPAQARQAGLNETIRWRPKANRVEIELPIDDRPSVYDSEKGRRLGKGAKVEKEIGNGKLKKESGSGRSGREEEGIKNQQPPKLRKTRLESNEVPHTTGYMIGVIRDGALHLTPVESIIQLRPSMHYLDEIDRLNKEAGRRGGAGKAGGEELSDVEMSGGDQSAGESKDAKPKGKAMSMHATVKVGEAGKGGPGDRDHLMRAQRLADGEPWVELEWAGEVSPDSDSAFKTKLFASSKAKLDCKTKPREYLPEMD